MKGVSTFISTVFIVLLSIVSVSIVLSIGGQTISRAKEGAIINEAAQNMKTLNNFITEVASESPGSLRKVPIKITDGTYRVLPVSGTFEYELGLTSDILQIGSFKKEDNIQTIVGGTARANQNSTNLILENEILEVVLSKNGTETNFDSINTTDIIKTIRLKGSGQTLRPNDTSIMIGNYSNSSWGIGYSKLVSESNNLAKAEALAHIKSNLTNTEYEVLYTLPTGADFLLVTVKNVSANQSTANLIYHLSSNATTDVIRMGGYDEGISSVNDSLVAWWKFDDNSGTNVADYSNNGNTGIINGVSQAWNSGWNYTDCKFNSCLKFDGSNDYINIPPSSTTNYVTGKPISVLAWIKPNDLNSKEIFGVSTGQSIIRLFYAVNEGLAVQFNGAGSVGATLTANEWAFVGFTYDGATLKIYKNAVSSSFARSAPDTYTGNWSIGYNELSGYFNGTIDNVKIYSRALTSDEVKTEYNNSIQGPFFTGCYNSANLSSYYACSYDNIESSQSISSGLIYNGPSSDFVKTCFFNQTYDYYKFNLTVNRNLKYILPFSQTTCQSIDDKMNVIKKQDVPSFAFGSYDIRGGKSLHMSLVYDAIKITGSGKFGPGTHNVCLQKTGEENLRAVVNVTAC